MIKAAVLMINLVLMGSVFASELQSNNPDTFRTAVEHSVTKITIDVSQVKDVFQASALDSSMDELVEQSLHASDRRFSLVG